jgi:uncharacterized protein YndB with AHSA1/START domain
VDPVTVHTSIDRPLAEVFDYLVDVANHQEFSDHYLTGWRLTREDSVGVGAGARFKQGGRLNRFGYFDLNLVEVEAPHRIVAVGRGGKFNRFQTWSEWLLEPTSTGTRVEYSYEQSSDVPTDKLVEAAGGRKAYVKRNSAKALRRLRSILEENRDRGARASVGGLDRV